MNIRRTGIGRGVHWGIEGIGALFGVHTRVGSAGFVYFLGEVMYT